MRRTALIVMLLIAVASLGRLPRAAEAVKSPPTTTKGFSPATIPLNGTATLTVVVTNPNTAPADSLINVSFADTFPAGMAIATPTNASTTCGISGPHRFRETLPSFI